jgi:uncharacterized protein (TIGR02594 family)
MTSIPPWLAVMKTLTGTKEVPGPEANPVITGMTDEIARIFPDMKWYCDLPSWDSDETAWCGVAAAYCMAEAGVRPPFEDNPAPDTSRFGWALSWADDLGFTPISAPVPGCVVVLERSGGGHVTFYESTSGSTYMCRGGNQSNSVNLSGYDKSTVVALMWPIDVPLPPAPKPTLQKGDTGPEVVALQHSLGLLYENADGDFGGITETQVAAFQKACGLSADGVCGEDTWTEVDALDARVAEGGEELAPELEAAIINLANNSALADYSWPDNRGLPPPGYIAGMCCVFAVAATWLDRGDSAAMVMAEKKGNPDKDALAYLNAEFKAAGMTNDVAGIDTLRHLFVLLIGLGMRESSGKYCEGRDMSASNTASDTCESGLFQSSWNFSSASPEIPKLFDSYWSDPNGFLPTFAQDISPTSSNLDVYGSGKGAAYQWLAKFCPAFAAMSTAVGLRVIRAHWGPIGRKEVTITELADDLLLEVQNLLEDTPSPEPAPEPEKATVAIVTTGDVVVTVNGEVVG